MARGQTRLGEMLRGANVLLYRESVQDKRSNLARNPQCVVALPVESMPANDGTGFEIRKGDIHSKSITLKLQTAAQSILGAARALRQTVDPSSRHPAAMIEPMNDLVAQHRAEVRLISSWIPIFKKAHSNGCPPVNKTWNECVRRDCDFDRIVVALCFVVLRQPLS